MRTPIPFTLVPHAGHSVSRSPADRELVSFGKSERIYQLRRIDQPAEVRESDLLRFSIDVHAEVRDMAHFGKEA